MGKGHYEEKPRVRQEYFELKRPNLLLNSEHTFSLKFVMTNGLGWHGK